MTPIIIQGGVSEYGWSRIGTFQRCPRLFWLREQAKRNGKKRVPAFPLLRGLIGHAGLAQRFAMIGARQAGRDPAAYASPLDAMQALANEYAAEDYDLTMRAFEAALAAYDHHSDAFPVEAETWRVRAVELLVETMFGAYPYTARLDLVMEDPFGKYWAIDHKIVGRIEDKVFTRYALSGQFLGMFHLGVRKWSDRFGGIMLNVIAERGTAIRRQIEPAPYALRRFPEQIVRAEWQIKQQDMSDESEWEMRLHEQVCVSAYGVCEAFEICRWGSGA